MTRDHGPEHGFLGGVLQVLLTPRIQYPSCLSSFRLSISMLYDISMGPFDSIILRFAHLLSSEM